MPTLFGPLPLLLGSLDDPIGRWEDRAIWTAGFLLLVVVLWLVIAPWCVVPRLMRSERKLFALRLVCQLGLAFFVVRGAAILLDAATNLRGAGGILSRWAWLRDSYFHANTDYWVSEHSHQWWFHYPLMCIAGLALVYSIACRRQILWHWRDAVERRWSGVCWQCRYPIDASIAICPECGHTVRQSHPAALKASGA